ncbi:hypothetical protein Lepto782_16185 [Leptospira interrogans serovar Canicola]|uniref:Uncharacterized protein n=1 Tax=Leptospira interrogans serovar Canicola TaxID=211880 RepID=A0AAP9WE35_LEPIR|nr:hypothetical protein Lepto782_16185 [Leptospira interrogans serovar Canicola]
MLDAIFENLHILVKSTIHFGYYFHTSGAVKNSKKQKKWLKNLEYQLYNKREFNVRHLFYKT